MLPHEKIKIEHAIIPEMIRRGAAIIVMELPERKEAYAKTIETSSKIVEYYLGNIHLECNRKLYKSLYKLASKLDDHFRANKYLVLKQNIVLSKWANALIEAEQLEITIEEYKKLIVELYNINEEGFNRDGDEFIKFDNSAAKQVGKIHAIAQQEGYF